MAKTTGLGDDLYVAGGHIGGDIQSLTLNGGPATIDTTDITQSAFSRLGGIRIGSVKVVAYHDPAPAQSHSIYSALPTTDQIVSYLRGQAVGNPVACCQSRQLNYDPTRDTAGALTFAVDAESDAFGLEWGVQLTADPRTDTTPTTGAFFDQGAGGTNGCQAYLQLVSLTGTNVDVSITHATTSGGSYTTLLDFGSQTVAPVSIRQTAAGTVNEFLKVVTTGTFTSATFFVAFMLNPVPVVF